VWRKDRVSSRFHFHDDCLRLVGCDVVPFHARREPLPSSGLPSTGVSGGVTVIGTSGGGHNSCEGLLEGRPCETDRNECSSGANVKESCANSLPFRKRKVADFYCDETKDESDCVQAGAQENSHKHNTNQVKQDDLNVQTESNDQQMQDSSQDAAVKESSEIVPESHLHNDTQASSCDTEIANSSVLIEMSKCSLNTASADEPQPLFSCMADIPDIEYINDIHLNSQYCHVLENCLKSRTGDTRPSLLYITHRLSFLGIQAAKIGFKSVTIATMPEHFSTILQIAEMNGCRSGQY